LSESIVTRCLPAVLALAVIGAAGFRINAAPQATRASAVRFEKRVVTTGLENPFQIVWGPDDDLWITERTAGRVTRVRPSDGSKTVAIAISDVSLTARAGCSAWRSTPGC
jgi:glucose/arabinose dehydrogenase